MTEYAELINRLRGIYRIAITDGLGPAGGEEPDNPNEFVRTFQTPPIQHEAADAIATLLARAEKAEKERDEANARADRERAAWVEWRELHYYGMDAALAEKAGKPRVKALEWVEGIDISTDDDGGPMERVPRLLRVWRASTYLIIRQATLDGRFILHGKSNGIGLVVPSLDEAKSAAQADYEALILSALEPSS